MELGLQKSDNQKNFESKKCNHGDNNIISKNEKEDTKDMYHVKWIVWSGGKSPIVTQNLNGPCPLLAIFNVLLLSKRIELANTVEIVSSSQITSLIADMIWKAVPLNLSVEERLNYEQNISDALAIFPNLLTGLDVNIKFNGVSSFEYTPELTIFDLLQIPLYHGWLVDPQDVETVQILGQLSYNQVVEAIINNSSSSNPGIVQQGLIAKEFLDSSASQLTYYGIVALLEEMQPGSLAVLFRNNHFSTIYRWNNELFTLMNDLGFLKETNVVWESLSSVQGDSQFVDGNFHISEREVVSSTAPIVSQTTDYDFELALSLQQCQHPPRLTSIDVRQGLCDSALTYELQKPEDHLSPQPCQSSPHHQHLDGNSKNGVDQYSPRNKYKHKNEKNDCMLL